MILTTFKYPSKTCKLSLWQERRADEPKVSRDGTYYVVPLDIRQREIRTKWSFIAAEEATEHDSFKSKLVLNVNKKTFCVLFQQESFLVFWMSPSSHFNVKTGRKKKIQFGLTSAVFIPPVWRQNLRDGVCFNLLGAPGETTSPECPKQKSY